jgi:hypothetical protein
MIFFIKKKRTINSNKIAKINSNTSAVFYNKDLKLGNKSQGMTCIAAGG